jgi:hypothetical protein
VLSPTGIYAKAFLNTLIVSEIAGYLGNYKCVYQVYYQLQLNLRYKRNKCIHPQSLDKRPAPNKQGECWTINFMSDSSRNQHDFKTFNVINDFNREALAIDNVVRLPAERISHYLDINWLNIIVIRKKYGQITRQNLPETPLPTEPIT